MKKIGEVPTKQFSLRPRFTVVHHPVRQKFGLTMIEYSLIDSIDQLSHRPDHPWCTTPKEALADFLSVARRSIFNAIKAGIENELLEKNDRGDLRTTQKWIEQVRLYNAQESLDF